PFAWLGKGPVGTSVPIDVRLQSDTGTYAALNEFFASCDAHPVKCTFSRGPSSTRWKFHVLMQRLQDHPVTTGIDGRVDYQTAVNEVRVDLYNQCCWEDLSDFLQRMWTHSTAVGQPLGPGPAAAPPPEGPRRARGRRRGPPAAPSPRTPTAWMRPPPSPAATATTRPTRRCGSDSASPATVWRRTSAGSGRGWTRRARRGGCPRPAATTARSTASPPGRCS